ncbi:MAG: GspE/PulE family protein [Paracoccaceae bacterium]
MPTPDRGHAPHGSPAALSPPAPRAGPPTAAGPVEDPRIEALLARLEAEATLEPGALDRVREIRALEGGRADILLSRLGLVAEATVAEHWAAVLGRAYVAERALQDAEARIAGLDPDYLDARSALPLESEDGGLTVIQGDPLDDAAPKAIAFALGRPARRGVGPPAAIKAALERARRRREPQDATAARDLGLDIARLRDLASDAPVVRWVDGLLDSALAARASDIHLDPRDGSLRVRLRVDGALTAIDPPPAEIRAAVLSRFKIMGALDIAEQRLPQDGRATATLRGRRIDLRIATAPTPFGETVVIRLLDGQEGGASLEGLGYSDRALGQIRTLLARPAGILLATGPTGSGKTTTLYAALKALDAPSRKLLTVEDPVEYLLDGVTQIQANAEIGLGFARVLRSVLRHNPDVVMIGEIRDRETAEIAVEAALTGHPVLSTLHTNSAAGAVTRLRDMGVPAYLLAAVLSGAIAQRLVRRLCPDCAEPAAAPAGLAARLGLGTLEGLRQAPGCRSCRGTGRQGRIAVAEVLTADPEIRRLILAETSEAEIASAAEAAGMVPLVGDALAKASVGLIAIEDALRLGEDLAIGEAE